MVALISILAMIAVCAAITCGIRDFLANMNGNAHSAPAAPTTQRSPTGRTETGSMVYFADDPHGSGDREYRFNYKKIDGAWRAYILRMPDLRGRDAGSVATHRLFDRGRPYICWDRKVKTLKEMQTISRVWANNIQEYIATGKRFGPH